MRQVFFCVTTLLALSTSAFPQTASSDSQTLQALLGEVRALRQELRVSLNRSQSIQILLARFQLQEGVVTRTSDHFNDARQRLSDSRLHQKELALETKRLEDELNTANSQQQADLQDRMTHVKSALEVTASLVQQQETAEIQAQQQLRAEQDRMSALESQLDELIRAMASSNEKSIANRP